MRAKFKVNSVKRIPFTSQEGKYYEEVRMQAVCSADKNSEDNQFSEATPSGELTMNVSNPNAHGFLQEGKSYYLDFTEAN